MSKPAQNGFISAPIAPGLLFEGMLEEQEVTVAAWDDSGISLPGGATHFAIQTAAEGVLLRNRLPSIGISAGMYFSVPGDARIKGGAGVVISVTGYKGLFQLGGPLEPAGRLRYIDGCSDTLLIAPPRRGEPCLNHLHVPPNTRQTMHTHPSLRVGVIVSGFGECRTPEVTHRLTPGLVWAIPAGSRHAFATGDSALDVIAWHPDSDFGPTDEVHPMINRTDLK